MLRRLHASQPASFAFTPANEAWARAQMTKYPEGRQASAIIPLLWRAQEQEGWLTRPAIEHVAQMLGLAYIRALEVATFYFMFHLHPVGTVAHIQICGTSPCMVCGAEELVAVCRELIHPKPHTPSADGRFSWEEVECLGACANAPMAQIGKDYYEDLTPAILRDLIAAFGAGEVPQPGPQQGRYASEPAGGLTSLRDHAGGRLPFNFSVDRARRLGDTVKRIDGTEVPLVTPWLTRRAETPGPVEAPEGEPVMPTPGEGVPVDKTGITVMEAPAETMRPDYAPPPSGAGEAGTGVAAPGQPVATGQAATGSGAVAPARPAALPAPRHGRPDDLTVIVGIGPKLAALCNRLGFWHFDQIAAWTPEETAWVDDNLEGFKGRVTRDRWVEQAKALAAGRRPGP